MDKDIFIDKNGQEATRFYYVTKGVYTSKIDILKKAELELVDLLKFKYSDKNKIEKTKELISRLKIEIEAIEELYKYAFD